MSNTHSSCSQRLPVQWGVPHRACQLEGAPEGGGGGQPQGRGTQSFSVGVGLSWSLTQGTDLGEQMLPAADVYRAMLQPGQAAMAVAEGGMSSRARLWQVTCSSPGQAGIC